MIPLLVQGTLDGEIDDAKLDEFLGIFDDESIRATIKSKLAELKVPMNLLRKNIKMLKKKQLKKKPRRRLN